MLHYHQDSETTSVVIFRKPASVGEGSSRILVPVVSNCRLRTTHYLTLTMWKEFLLLFFKAVGLHQTQLDRNGIGKAENFSGFSTCVDQSILSRKMGTGVGGHSKDT